MRIPIGGFVGTTTGLTAPNVSFAVNQSTRVNNLIIQFMSWYTANTQIRIEIINPDNNQVAYWFTIIINPLNTNHILNWGTDSSGVRLVPQADGIADLAIGRTATVTFGNRAMTPNSILTSPTAMGVTLDFFQVSNIQFASINTGSGLISFTNVALSNQGQTFRFQATYTDGIANLGGESSTETYSVRIVRLITAPDSGDVNITNVQSATAAHVDVNLDTSNRFPLTPNNMPTHTRQYRVISGNATIQSGNLLRIPNTVAANSSITVGVSFIQSYNGIQLFNGSTNATTTYNRAFTTRYINSVKQLSSLRNISNSSGMTFNLLRSFHIGAWTPIPSFGGILEGNNHTLSGMNITRAALSTDLNVGLFASINNGEVRNLTISGSSINIQPNHAGNGWTNAGLVAGTNTGASTRFINITIVNSSVIVHRTNSRNGMLIGFLHGGIVSGINVRGIVDNSHGGTHGVATLGVFSNGHGGGIIGEMLNSTLENSSVDRIDVSFWLVNTQRNTGGLVGFARQSTVRNNSTTNNRIREHVSSSSGRYGNHIGERNGGIVSGNTNSNTNWFYWGRHALAPWQSLHWRGASTTNIGINR